MICPRDGADGLDWSAGDLTRWGAFYEACNLDDSIGDPWRPLGQVHEVFEFDFTESEVKLSGQTDLEFVAEADGIMNCVCFWYKMSLTANVDLDHTPLSLRSPGASPLSGDQH